VRDEKNQQIGQSSNTLYFRESRTSLSKKIYLLIWSSSILLLFGVTGVAHALYPDYSAGLLSKVELGMALAGMYASSMITNLIAGRIRLHYGLMIRSGLSLAALGTILAVYYPVHGFILIGMGSGIGLIGLPVAVSYMQNDRGLLMGIFNTYTYAGLGFMPIIAGALVPNWVSEWFFLLQPCPLSAPINEKNSQKREVKNRSYFR
jgi:MFS family permease